MRRSVSWVLTLLVLSGCSGRFRYNWYHASPSQRLVGLQKLAESDTKYGRIAKDDLAWYDAHERYKETLSPASLYEYLKGENRKYDTDAQRCLDLSKALGNTESSTREKLVALKQTGCFFQVGLNLAGDVFFNLRRFVFVTEDMSLFFAREIGSKSGGSIMGVDVKTEATFEMYAGKVYTGEVLMYCGERDPDGPYRTIHSMTTETLVSLLIGKTSFEEACKSTNKGDELLGTEAFGYRDGGSISRDTAPAHLSAKVTPTEMREIVTVPDVLGAVIADILDDAANPIP